jgi:hypothetical protein
MPFAKENIISKAPIDGGIEISQEQYDMALQAKLNGQDVFVQGGELLFVSSQTRTIYNKETGQPKEIAENVNTPDGFTGTPRPSSAHVWNGTEWALDTAVFNESLTQALKERRDKLWSNSTITLSNGAELRVNERTRKDISDVYESLLAANLSQYEGWNAVNGRYTLTLANFQEAKILGLQVVAKAFDAYNVVIDTHEDTPYTNIEDAITALETAFNTEA